VICFVAPSQETWCMETYLGQEGRPLADRIRILTFEEIAAAQQIQLGTYIFAAIDQLSKTEKEIGELCYERLSAENAEIKLLNDPGKVLCRRRMLSRCFELGRNTYQVKGVSGLFARLNFPVFIRNERRHTGSLTRLLHSRGELVAALAKAIAKGNLPRDIMIAEYRDTADPSGIFREYNAQIVDGRIIPQAVVHSHNWVTKWKGRIFDAEKAREEAEYLHTNPHVDWLRETFRLANIQYGRIDYGVRNGVPQVWEINTNPMITLPLTWGTGQLTAAQRALRAPVRAQFFRGLAEALIAIDCQQGPGKAVRIEVSPRQRRNLKREKRWLHRGMQWDWRTGRMVKARAS
jgi:hypothetical protein